MRAIKHALAIAWKELQLLSKDRGGLAVLFLLPLIVATTMGAANRAGARSDGEGILVNTCLVNQDAGIFGEQIAAAVESIPVLEVTRVPSAAEAEDIVARGEAVAAIVIPAGLSDQIHAYTPVQVEVIVDPGQPDAASIVTGIMNQVVDQVAIWGEVSYGIRAMLSQSEVLAQAEPNTLRAIEAQSLGTIMATLEQMRRTPAITVASETDEQVVVQGGFERYMAFGFAGMVVMFIFFGVTTSARSLRMEKETGTLRRLVAAPIPRGSVIAGTMLAYVVLGALQTGFLFLVGRLLFKMSLGNSAIGLLVHTLALSLAAAAMGVMIAALARSARQADSVALILGFVMGGLGGCIAMGMSPLTRSGGALQTLALLTPQGHGVEGFYRLMVEGSSLLRALPESAILVGFAAVFFLVGTWRFKYE
ncbi:MAG TPA: ABC transporter permease [Anaerolineae bacterium]|nr:ABC transporter permease [Anaerolineae bacterium]